MTDTRPEDALFEWERVEDVAYPVYYERIRHLFDVGSREQHPWVVVQHRKDSKWYASHVQTEAHEEYRVLDMGGFEDIEQAMRLAETLSVVHPQRPELPEEE